MDVDTVVLMAARASRTENQDAIDAAIVGMLADPKEVCHSYLSPLVLLIFSSADFFDFKITYTFIACMWLIIFVMSYVKLIDTKGTSWNSRTPLPSFQPY